MVLLKGLGDHPPVLLSASYQPTIFFLNFWEGKGKILQSYKAGKPRLAQTSSGAWKSEDFHPDNFGGYGLTGFTILPIAFSAGGGLGYPGGGLAAKCWRRSLSRV